MDEEKKDEGTQWDPEEKEEGSETKPAEAPEAPPVEDEVTEEAEEGPEEAEDDEEKEESPSDKPKGASLAMISFVLGLIATGAGVLIFLFRILAVFLKNVCFGFCLTGPGACLSGLVGGLSMIAAIIIGIIALVMGAGGKKLYAILGIVLGCCFVVISIIGVIIALVLNIFI
ncbi:MAG: hypothetical protein QCI82_08745 [Candidatus Thermoplasmatota archaeon]|nr:hypothetical protein [Candidatus Thermoplasmatota archaeon]